MIGTGRHRHARPWATACSGVRIDSGAARQHHRRHRGRRRQRHQRQRPATASTSRARHQSTAATSSRATTSAPTPPARLPWPTRRRRVIDSGARATPSAARPPAPATSSPATAAYERRQRLPAAATTGNLVAGNFIGTDATGTSRPRANSYDGILVIGRRRWQQRHRRQRRAWRRNVIAGNSNAACRASAAPAPTAISSRATTSAPTPPAPPRWPTPDGVLIDAGASSNTIGGTTAGAGNVISGNTGDGIGVTAAARGNVIEGNYIGTNAAGTAALANRQWRHRIERQRRHHRRHGAGGGQRHLRQR